MKYIAKYTYRQLEDIYKNFLLSACFTDKGKNKRIMKAEFDYQKISDMFNGLGTVFDVGAAGGFFLKVFKDHGWVIDGNELSVKAILYADEHFGIKLKYGFLKETIKRSDLFLFWNTLEHLPDPVKAIKLVKDNLNAGGMVYTNIPLNDPSYPHVTTFTQRSILELFKGFKCVYHDFHRDVEPQYIIQLWKER